MKKISAMLLASLLLLCALAGCTPAETPDNPGNTANSNFSGPITVVSREDGSGTRGAFIELFGIELKNDDGTKKDLELAEAVIASDKAVNVLFRDVQHDLIALIRQDMDCGEQALNLLMVAKYFERIGDHAKNIAEWVVFSITGEHVSASTLEKR